MKNSEDFHAVSFYRRERLRERLFGDLERLLRERVRTGAFFRQERERRGLAFDFDRQRLDGFFDRLFDRLFDGFLRYRYPERLPPDNG